MKGKAGRLIIITILCAALLFGLVILRVWLDARRELKSAELAEFKGDLWEAVLHYRLAISAYLPFASYPSRAAQKLSEIAKKAEERGDTLLALEAHHAIRSGFLSARSFYTPKKEWIEKSEVEIVRLLIARGEPQKIYGDVPSNELEKLIRQDLNRYKSPNHLLSLAAVLALIGWAVFAGAGVFQLAKGDYKSAAKRFFVFAALYIIWALCLLKA